MTLEIKMKVTKLQLREIIRCTLLESLDTEDELEEQDAVPGVMEPLGTGSPSSRRRRRRGATAANAEAFGGGRVYKEDVSKAAPFGSGMEQADLDKDQKEIVGHT